MSATMDWLVRGVTRSTMRVSTAEWAGGKQAPQTIRAALNVNNTLGDTVALLFESKYILNSEAARSQEDETDLHSILQLSWPDKAGARTLRTFGDGLQLCDAAAALRSDTFAVALMEYGVMNGWWQLVYDENITCTHASGSCPQYCTIYVDGYKRAIGRRKRKKEKAKAAVLSKFRLSDLLPERGVAIA